tara:strand:+ start:2592 stop:3227 length:636 start_codon:yes stop_codon:yes gene_type:complete
MSRINLNTSDDIVSFLKILAEESVKDAKQEMISTQMKRDEKTYGSLDEVDPPEEEEVEVDAEEEEVEVEQDETVNLEVSMDSISDAIKQLRSGRSVDDSMMKSQLRTYFNRLEETEREALLAFLTAFSGILTGVASGENAPDPSDPPYSISMFHKDDNAKAEKPEVDVEEEEVEEEEVSDEPADSPPIKAGAESQSLKEIRRRVRELMTAR